MSELPKTFDPASIEARWAQHWEERGLFRPERPDAEPYTIVNPPPNVTGALHIGHALDNTLQDVLIRYERLRGKDALWVVGTDHAGIATQMVVERQLAERQDKRTNYSRDDFVAKVWEWKAESGGQITRQLRRLGCSMDWSREQFTMDENFSKAVIKVFVDLYNQGLLYRDKRLVNWDPGLKTAISDLEVETRETQGGFWRFRYPLADGSGALEVATTRPETMLADMAVAVHPDDARYAALVGKDIRQPLTGRLFKMVADEHADPELGSGCVKITPGHDFNDFEVGKRAGIEPRDMLNMFDGDAKVVQTADGLIPEEYLGLDRFDARKLVVQRMKEAGFLVRYVDKDGVEHDHEPRTIQTPYGDRSGQVIEPWLTDQWYVDAATLAQPAMEAVRSGAVEIVPKSWEKTFFNWMENIQPWCVSRQLWWGHRIPAWYGPAKEADGTQAYIAGDGTFGQQQNECFVADSESEAIILAKARYGDEIDIEVVSGPAAGFDLSRRSKQNTIGIWQDEDVLDTWFSSALWPFATLGWPDGDHSTQNPRHAELVSASRAAESGGSNAPWTLKQVQGDEVGGRGEGSLLARHYPNDVLISGFDILFFWDARMLMQGIHFMGRNGELPLSESVPWKRLYLHGLVRAPDGTKMAKTRGNVVNPLILIDKYGADALRFFMTAMESQGRDIKMDDARLEGYRNFATKLWNATRFCQANGIGASATLKAPVATLPVNRWIIGEVAETVTAMETALANLRFDDAANAIYQFAWSRFCDWYLELIKGQIDEETKLVAGWVLDQILVMLHPFMPFITEELWHAQGQRRYELIVAKWPEPRAVVDAEAKGEIEWVIGLTTEIRTARTAANIPPSLKMPIIVDAEIYEDERGQDRGPHPATLLDRVRRHGPALSRLARLSQAWPMYGKNAVELETNRVVKKEALASGLNTISVVFDDHTYYLPLEGIIDVAAERARLTKAIEEATKDRDSLAARLANPAFTERAKPEAVAKATEDHAARAGEVERLSAALARLG